MVIYIQQNEREEIQDDLLQIRANVKKQENREYQSSIS